MRVLGTGRAKKISMDMEAIPSLADPAHVH